MAGIGTPEYTDRVLAQAVDAKRERDLTPRWRWIRRRRRENEWLRLVGLLQESEQVRRVRATVERGRP
jgi:hypothetical protein